MWAACFRGWTEAMSPSYYHHLSHFLRALQNVHEPYNLYTEDGTWKWRNL